MEPTQQPKVDAAVAAVLSEHASVMNAGFRPEDVKALEEKMETLSPEQRREYRELSALSEALKRALLPKRPS